MSNVCESCQQSYCDQLFTNILSGSSDIPFNRIITYGCVSKLLTWAKSKQTALKDNKSRVDSVDMQQDVTARSVATFKNISELVRAVIRNIHTYGAGGSCRDSERQLKPNLPQFCHLNETIFRTLTSGSVHCCSTAECLYVSQSNTTSARKTDAERKRTSRQNSDSRQNEQSVDTARRKKCRQDNDVRQREQSVNTARRKTCRQNTDV